MILLIYILSLLNVNEIESTQGCLQIDIMLVGDLSGSIDGNEYIIADAYDAFVNRFELADNTMRIGAVVFSDNTFILSHLTSTKNILVDRINYMRTHRLGGTTNMYGALDFVWKEFKQNGRKNVRKMIIILSDGEVDHPEETAIIIEQMKLESNIEICAVYIDTYSGKEEYMANISNTYCYVSTSYQALIFELERLDICF